MGVLNHWSKARFCSYTSHIRLEVRPTQLKSSFLVFIQFTGYNSDKFTNGWLLKITMGYMETRGVHVQDPITKLLKRKNWNSLY